MPLRDGDRMLDKTLWGQVFAVLSLGLLFGSVWAARGQEVFSSAGFIPLNHVMNMVVLLAVAAMGERLAMSQRTYAAVGSVAFVVHVLAVAMAFALSDSMTLIALGLASTFFEGVAMAALQMVVLRYALTLGTRRAMVLMALSFLLGQVYDCVFMDAGQAVATAQWLLGSALAFGLLWGLVAVVRTDAAARDSQTGHSTDSGGKGPEGGSVLFVFPWGALVGFSAIVLLQYGLTQSFTGFGGIGSIAHYGLAAGVVMVVVRTVVACLCGLQIRWRADRLVSAVGLCWVVSLCVTLCTWGTGLAVVADWMRTAVYYALQVLPVAIALACAGANPKSTTSTLAVGMAVSLTNQVSRLVGWAIGLGELSNAHGALAAYLCVGIVVTVLSLAVIYTLLLNGASAASTPVAERAPVRAKDIAMRADDAEGSQSPTVQQAIDFAHRFDGVCSLYNIPAGERDALLQAVHGYTIDNIAANLGVSRETVKTSLSRAYARMGINGKQAFLSLIESADQSKG